MSDDKFVAFCPSQLGNNRCAVCQQNVLLSKLKV
jgi:hypothetical protein